MAEITKEEIFKMDVMSIKDFCAKHGAGVKPQAISYAIKEGIIDFVQVGFERLVVMTDKTKEYVPNDNSRREKPKKRNGAIRIKSTTIGL